MPIPNHCEVLRFNFKPRGLRLVLAAMADPGPSSHFNWSLRSGIGTRHLAEIISQLIDLGIIAAQPAAEGMKLLVQPVEFWRERPICRRDVWIQAWANVARQTRLDLVTEWDGLPEALANAARANVAGDPEAAYVAGGKVDKTVNKSLPESGTPRFGEQSPRFGEQKVPESGSPCTTRAGDVKRNDVTVRYVPSADVGTFNETNGEQLRQRVREFVGHRDWERFWAQPRWCRIFEEPERAALLDGALRFLLAGIADGSVRIRVAAGAALWEQFGRMERERMKK